MDPHTGRPFFCAYFKGQCASRSPRKPPRRCGLALAGVARRAEPPGGGSAGSLTRSGGAPLGCLGARGPTEIMIDEQVEAGAML